MREWRNRQTRTFEGRVGDRTGSIPVSRTKHKRPSQKTRSFMFFAKLHIEPFKCLLANTLFACSNNIQLQTLAQTVVPDSRLSHQNKKERIYPLFFVLVWDEEFNPSLEHLCSRIGAQIRRKDVPCLNENSSANLVRASEPYRLSHLRLDLQG